MKSGIKTYKSDKYISSYLTKALYPGLTFVDVGANEGMLTVAAANLVGSSGRVYSFEYCEAAVSKLKGVIAGSGTSGKEARSLDDYFKGKGWPPVNVVKIDIEGAQADILNGMKELCRRNKGIKVFVSLKKSISTTSEADFEKFWAGLSACGLFHVRIIGRKINECRIPEDIPDLFAKLEREGISLLCEVPFFESPTMKEGDQIITSAAKMIPAGRLKKVLAKLFDTYVFLFNRLGLYDLNYYKKYYEFRKGDVVIDCGAHRGLCTVGLAKLVGKTGKVIAIEPDPDNLKELRKVTAHFSNVIIVGKGAWSSKSTMKLYAHQYDYGHSFFKELVGAKEKYEMVEVEVDTLDDIMTELGITKVNFIKMNIEGAEIEALKGASKILAKNYLSLAIEAQHEINGIPTNKTIIPMLEKVQYSTFLGPKGEVYARKNWLLTRASSSGKRMGG